MSLTNIDLKQISIIFENKLDEKLAPVSGKLEAVENDVKDIYKMLSNLQEQAGTKLLEV